MSYLRKKLQAIMACADFKGYLREVTGYPLTLTDCMGNDLVSLSVTGNAVQDGTPSPETPVEVQGVGERTSNLFDKSLVTVGRSAQDGGANAGWGYINNPVYATSDKIYLKPNTTYSFILFNNDVYWVDRIIEADENDICTYNHSMYTDKSNNYYCQRIQTKETTQYVIIRFRHILDDVNFTDDDLKELKFMILEADYPSSFSPTDTLPPYEPYGYKVPISVSSNLFDVSQLVSNRSGYVQDGKVYITAYPYVTYLTPEMFLEMTGLKEGDTFSACADYEQITAGSGAMYCYFSRKSSAPQDLQTVYLMTAKGAFTVSTIPNGFNSDNYNYLYMYGGGSGGEIRAIYSNIRVYKGAYTAETMPPYEPYHAPQTVNIYTDKPLYGLNGEAWSEIVFDGTEGWYTTTAATDGKINYFIAGPTLNSNSTGPKKSACSHFEWSSSHNAVLTDLNTHKVYGFSNYSCWIGVCVSVSDYPTADDWEAFLQAQYAAGTPLKLYVATEDSASAETITPTYKGTTVLSTATTVQPSSMTAKYYATKEG